MFIKFFRHSYIHQYLLFFVFALALWMPTFLNPPYIGAQSTSTPLYNLLIQLTNSKLIWAILAFGMLLLQSLFFNLILINNDFIRRTSLLGSVLYFSLMSHHPSFQQFNPVLVSHFFLLMTIYYSLHMYGKESVLRNSFRLGFYIGLATLFYLPSIFFLILIYFTLLIFRVSYWRQWLIPLFSFFTPYVFLFTYYFVTDKLYLFSSYFEDFFNGFTISWPYNDTFSLITSIALGIIILMSFVNTIRRKSEKSVYVRKKIIFFIYFFLISLISLLISTESMTSFTTFIIPISLFVAVYFNDLRKTLWIEIFFACIIVSIFINIY